MFTLRKMDTENVSGAQYDDSRVLGDVCVGLFSAFGLYAGTRVGFSDMHDVASMGDLVDNLSTLGKSMLSGCVGGAVFGAIIGASYDKSIREYTQSNHHFIKVHL